MCGWLGEWTDGCLVGCGRYVVHKVGAGCVDGCVSGRVDGWLDGWLCSWMLE